MLYIYRDICPASLFAEKELKVFWFLNDFVYFYFQEEMGSAPYYFSHNITEKYLTKLFPQQLCINQVPYDEHGAHNKKMWFFPLISEGING